MELPQLDYKLLKALHTVLREQSFEGAARRLFITQSAVSQRIKQLEAQFGQPLLNRSQPMQPTALGRQLLGHYQRVQQLETEFQNQLEGEGYKAQALPLSVNADSLATWLVPALSPLLQQQKVELNLYVIDESKTWKRMRSGEALACVTSKAEPLAGSEAIFLGYMDYLCVASPGFIQRFFTDGVTRESLREAPAMAFDQHDDMHLSFLEEHFDLKQGDYPCHTVRSSEAFVDFSLASGAYSLNSRLHMQQHLDSGRLVNILPELKVRVPLYWHHWQLAGKLMQRVTRDIICYTREVLVQK